MWVNLIEPNKKIVHIGRSKHRLNWTTRPNWSSSSGKSEKGELSKVKFWMALIDGAPGEVQKLTQKKLRGDHEAGCGSTKKCLLHLSSSTCHKREKSSVWSAYALLYRVYLFHEWFGPFYFSYFRAVTLLSPMSMCCSKQGLWISRKRN
jgi:hypothetical protein